MRSTAHRRGHEVQRGSRNYPVINIAGWITGATLAAIDTAFQSVNDVLSALAGGDGDKIVIAYTGTGTTTITNIEQVGSARIMDTGQKGSTYIRQINFSVRQCA